MLPVINIPPGMLVALKDMSTMTRNMAVGSAAPFLVVMIRVCHDVC